MLIWLVLLTKKSNRPTKLIDFSFCVAQYYIFCPHCCKNCLIKCNERVTKTTLWKQKYTIEKSIIVINGYINCTKFSFAGLSPQWEILFAVLLAIITLSHLCYQCNRVTANKKSDKIKANFDIRLVFAKRILFFFYFPMLSFLECVRCFPHIS